jgi:uncharacterized membrane protein
MMKPVWRRSGGWISAVFVLDISRSVSSTFIDSALEWVDDASSRGSRSRNRYIAFAGEPRLVGEIEQIRSLPVSTTGRLEGASLPAGTVDQSRTNIEHALTQALRSFSPHSIGHVVLITDGRETAGDLTRAVQRARELGVRIFTVPAEMRWESSISIENVELPREIRAGEPIHVEVQVASPISSTTTLGLDRIEENGNRKALARKDIALDAGINTVSVPVRLEQSGLITLETRLLTEEDSRVLETLWVGPKHRVLYLEGRPESATYLREALESEGLDVRLVSASGLPESEQLLDRYDNVIVSDVSASQMSEGRMAALRSYVDRGGGLIFIGGETSFGASGYAETPLEEALPVFFRVQEKHKEVALVIVLDKSYSMKGEKIELAKEATKAALDLLDETHYFGVVTFDWYPHVEVPLQLAEDKPRIKQKVAEIGASSPTRIHPALDRAYDQLRDNDAKVKHVILLSDGKSHRDAFEELVTKMTQDEITVSTVAVGEEVDRELLSQIAEWGRGRTYFIQDAGRVTEIFLEEAQIAMESTLEEEPFRPVVTGRVEALTGVDFTSAPLLRGFVNTEAKDSAEVLLETETEAPLLARWQFGLGKAVIFASDAKNRWASEWLDWEGYGKFWSQLVRETVRRQQGRQVDFRVERRGDVASVTLGVIDDEGHFGNGMSHEVEIVGHDGWRMSEPLRQTGPGRYETTVPLTVAEGGPYVFRLAGTDLDSTAAGDIGNRGILYAFPDEYRWRSADTSTLRQISEKTGGTFDPSVEEIYEDYGEVTTRPIRLWPYLSGVALFLYLLDLSFRRAYWVLEKLRS